MSRADRVLEWGDWQTPPDLARAVVALFGPLGTRFPRVLEPTCGSGNFIRALLETRCPPAEVLGIEVRPARVAEARSVGRTSRTRVRVIAADALRTDFASLPWRTRGPLLVIGNPPWVTNAALGASGGANLPEKSNFKGLRGLDARTGRSNFDLAEYLLIRLLTDLAPEGATVALLCKTSVARAVLAHGHAAGLPLGDASIRSLDARAWFGASVDACLFTVRTGVGAPCCEADVFGSFDAGTPSRRIGFARGRMVADLAAYRAVAHVDGTCPVEWRQGVKHDAAGVLELLRDGDRWRNGLGEDVDVEPDRVFPLVKGNDLATGRRAERALLLPQRAVGEDTTPLRWEAPRLFAYLQRHADAFTRRRSSIYRGRPAFAVFGVGPYTFAPHKVAVSGMGKVPRFVALGPRDGRPVVCDDTCYLLPCPSAREAARLCRLLNAPLCLRFLAAIAFPDAKRPLTKALLSRIDLATLGRALP